MPSAGAILTSATAPGRTVQIFAVACKYARASGAKIETQPVATHGEHIRGLQRGCTPARSSESVPDGMLEARGGHKATDTRAAMRLFAVSRKRRDKPIREARLPSGKHGSCGLSERQSLALLPLKNEMQGMWLS